MSAVRSQKPYNPSCVNDIQDSRVWKEFLDPNGKQFTCQSSNLVFGMFTDAINPYGNRQAGKDVSVTFIVLVCLSLPVELRRLPENVYLVGIAPGPREPSVELFNWVLIPIVEQLRTLWRAGLHLSQTYQHSHGRHIYAALLPFFADLPALRRSLGFSSATASRMCSYCLLPRQDISSLDSTKWPKRTLDEHRLRAIEYHHATSSKTRQQLLLAHGARYSALLKLEYWNIIDYHVIDAMHNLLLGLLQWHCRKLWCMSDLQANSLEPQDICPSELNVFVPENDEDLNIQGHIPSSSLNPLNQPDGPTILNTQFNSETDPRDFPFDPAAVDDGWNDHWTPASEDVILDSQALDFINRMLPRIRIPTWIKRAIPILGKASFGRLKADEWRSLFTIQLPLILPVFWRDSLPETRSLLHNFAHLVSLVNLALKRSTSADRINCYRHHILSYLESCLVIFEGVKLAPNHHMAIHLADCLERFGPARSYWSFPMERLMAQVLKAPNNNRLGEMEITFLRKFCQAGNLRALLERPDLPSSLDPFIRQLRAYYDPQPFEPSFNNHRVENSLDENLYMGLINKINEKFSIQGRTWIASSEYSKKQPCDRLHYAPVTSRTAFFKNHSIGDVVYSTTAENEHNSVLALKENLRTSYGRIEYIFQHVRSLPSGERFTDIFFAIKLLLPTPPGAGNPFEQLDKYEMQVFLCMCLPEERLVVFHESEIISHCAWIKLGPQEASEKIDFDTIAIVLLDRS